MSDILREVDDAMRVERMTRLWHEHGRTIIMVLAAIILGTAFNAGWVAYKDHKARTQTSAILDALKSDNAEDQLKELATSLSGSGKGFAALDAAALAIKDGKFENALSYYSSVEQDKSVPADLRDLSTIQRVSLAMDHQKDVDADALLASLSPVATSKTSPWAPRALLVQALIKANLKQDYAGALEDVVALGAEQAAPPSLQAQAKALQDIYAYKAQTSSDQ